MVTIDKAAYSENKPQLYSTSCSLEAVGFKDVSFPVPNRRNDTCYLILPSVTTLHVDHFLSVLLINTLSLKIVVDLNKSVVKLSCKNHHQPYIALS